MINHIRTKYILELYGLKRHTLEYWIRAGLLEAPDKDSRGWRIWTADSLRQVQEVIKRLGIADAASASHVPSCFKIANRRYLGSKQKLVSFIHHIIMDNISDFLTFFEPFAGTGILSNHYNNLGKAVIVNDILKSNHVVYRTFFDTLPYDRLKIQKIIQALNHLKSRSDNYYSRNFGNRYFTVENARRIGAIRDRIDALYKDEKINIREKDILITTLLYAADKVANTCGHYDAYRIKMDSIKSIRLLEPCINDEANSGNQIYCEDANRLIRRIEADVTYVDTPYNSRQYGDLYHVLENITCNEKPDLVGKARKMKGGDHLRSRYCTEKAIEAFKDLIENIRSRHILVSYNNMAQKGDKRSNARISAQEVLDILSARGRVKIYETDFSAFSAGKSNISGHKEMIYYCKTFKNEKDNLI